MALHCYATSISSFYRGDDNFTVSSFLHQRSWALWLMSECMLSSHNHIALPSCSHWRRWRDGRNIPTCWKLLEETKYFSVNLTRCDSALQMNLKRDKLFFFFSFIHGQPASILPNDSAVVVVHRDTRSVTYQCETQENGSIIASVKYTVNATTGKLVKTFTVFQCYGLAFVVWHLIFMGLHVTSNI